MRVTGLVLVSRTKWDAGGPKYMRETMVSKVDLISLVDHWVNFTGLSSQLKLTGIHARMSGTVVSPAAVDGTCA